ncbi:Ig-like domain-containing protein [bacterium]|nr:Ig-like domain-containing protein [bacterium]
MIAVLLTLGVLVGCGTAGGTGGGVVGFDPIAATPTVTSFVLSPKTSTLNAAQTVQFSLTATLSNGQIVNGASLATFVSSNSNLVTVAAGGLATGELPGTATITATIGGISDTATVTVNPFTDRLFVSNLTGNTVTVFDPAANGDVTPLGSYAGNNTKLSAPSQITVSGQELFVSNGNGSVTVFNLHARGNVAPKRTISGALTGLTDARGVAILNNEIYVSNFAPATISVFNINANGNVAPLRTIAGGNTLLSGPRNLSIFNNVVFAASSANNRVLGFPVLTNGDVAPTTNIGADANPDITTLAVPVGMLVTANEIFTDTAGSVLAFAPGATGNVAPIRTITGAATNVGDPRGMFLFNNLLFQSNFTNNNVNVFNRLDTGNVAPQRTIIGANTQMNGPACVFIAPSVI